MSDGLENDSYVDAIDRTSKMVDVRMLRVSALLHEITDGSQPLQARINLLPMLEQEEVNEQDGAFVVRVSCNISIERQLERLTAEDDTDDTGGASVATVDTEIAALFLVDRSSGDVSLDADGLRLFAHTKGVVYLHPFIREFVASLTTRMGLPALLLEPVTAPRPEALDLNQDDSLEAGQP